MPYGRPAGPFSENDFDTTEGRKRMVDNLNLNFQRMNNVMGGMAVELASLKEMLAKLEKAIPKQ